MNSISYDINRSGINRKQPKSRFLFNNNIKTTEDVDIMEEILSKQFSEDSDWQIIRDGLYQNSLNRLPITQYHLYLIVKQKRVPVPHQIIKTILNANPDLKMDQLYHLNVIIAFENQFSSPETLSQLLHSSSNPIALTYSILQHLIRGCSSIDVENNHFIHTFNSLPEDNLRTLIHETLVEALYRHDDQGNILLHQACKACTSPRIVRLLIEGMMNDIGWWCVVGTNKYERSSFHLALSCSSVHDANAVLYELLRVIPTLNLPDKQCIIRNDILHVSIRVGNMYLAFKILESYPELIHLWSSQGTLPLHDIFHCGNPVGMERFLDMFSGYIQSQIKVAASTWIHFIPTQIACMNPRSNEHIILRLLRFHLYECSFTDTVKTYGLLHLVATTSNVDVARYFVSLVPDALVYTHFQHFGFGGKIGPIPLFFACVSGSSEMIEFLFQESKKYPMFPYKHLGLIDSISGLDLHPIVAACSNMNITNDTMEMLLLESNIPLEWLSEWRILHCAAFEGNMEVAVAIISVYPDLLYVRDEDGNSPLYDACSGGDPNMIEYLFVEQARRCCADGCITIPANLFGMFDRNRVGLTAWDMVCEMVESILVEYDDSINQFHGLLRATMLVITFHAARNFYGYLDSKLPLTIPLTQLNGTLDPTNQQTIFPVYQSAIQMISSVKLLECVVMQNILNSDVLKLDNHGRTPLHFAVWFQQEEEDWSGIIHHLLFDEEHGSERCACIKDKDSRYALHTAADNGLSWNNGLSYIVDANETILDCKDPVTGLYPFMLAAAGDRSNLDSIFELLHRTPDTLCCLNQSISRDDMQYYNNISSFFKRCILIE